ncbi:hypothetical protein V0M98_38485 (plasmid) [Pseudomonas silesiensis]|uniref:hypothetical protein n=1 Tax=Pseudomonas silesiensis TaxID=1853130 RepID=UPI0030CBDB2C
MRIISPFRDYYDSSIGYGIDNTVVFHRASRELDVNAKIGADVPIMADIQDAVRRFEALKGDLTRRSHKVRPVYIGFCGKVYQGLVTYIDPKTGSMHELRHRDRNETETFMWRLKDAPEAQLDVKLVVRFVSDGAMNTLRDWFADDHLRCFDDVALFTKHQMVSFMYSPGWAIINPRLKDFEFQRLMGAVEAFQEISMFISGVLGAPGSPMIELQDKDRIVAHGFDDRSFRQTSHPRKSKKP